MKGLPSVEMCDSAVRFNIAGLQATGNVWFFRSGLFILLEISTKKLLNHYYSGKLKGKPSHNVLKQLGLLFDHVPDLREFQRLLDRKGSKLWNSILSYDYVNNRYSPSDFSLVGKLPDPKDMVDLYAILSRHLRTLGYT